MEKNSSSDPLRIDSVEIPGGGRIGITICPGKKRPHAASGSWNRDLEADLDAVRDWGAEALVSLIEPAEYRMVGVENLPERARIRMAHFALPIPDVGIPGPGWEEEWKEAGSLLRSMLRRGGKICLHCMGGLGRSGLVAARLLVELGKTPVKAIAAVRAARPGAIETREQEDYIRAQHPASDQADQFGADR